MFAEAVFVLFTNDGDDVVGRDDFFERCVDHL
jgi:hypothetical protein